ncbi:hypothetical protein M2222_001241 [Bradyrhizobium elkanii]|uniref:hypothetical protein n=1 Tax=Bradyrhizobium elkanii TaxID=29448 RepID=UPI002167FF49|nr:hypothetical protein [Bradyrhizobium elkanii]MCS3449936.1 hypothetical protein [Bradyrhizobium elkanii]MCS3558919.1 hypothetical protein [Bradyrhizobium elkanii]MCW2151233.1 hypothetical protein [Bradyrhizobium elkanii]MCW2374964.1 hypothetical protein [Bradyrhizobium elkanii]
MGLSTKGPITRYRGSWADLERRRREATLAMIEDDRVDAAIAIAGLREQVRAFEGIDRVRGL